jgi:hypothetical protein
MKMSSAWAFALVIAASWQIVINAECLDPPRKPIRVSGAVCGPFDRRAQPVLSRVGIYEDHEVIGESGVFDAVLCKNSICGYAASR